VPRTGCRDERLRRIGGRDGFGSERCHELGRRPAADVEDTLFRRDGGELRSQRDAYRPMNES
jgi:hypothetical protein